jgi:hypothetical protein
MSENLERRWDRLHLTLKDWLQIATLIGALVMQYVAMDRRLTVVETKMDLIVSGRMQGK